MGKKVKVDEDKLQQLSEMLAQREADIERIAEQNRQLMNDIYKTGFLKGDAEDDKTYNKRLKGAVKKLLGKVSVAFATGNGFEGLMDQLNFKAMMSRVVSINQTLAKYDEQDKAGSFLRAIEGTAITDGDHDPGGTERSGKPADEPGEPEPEPEPVSSSQHLNVRRTR